jgi:four helix bundle protein
MRDFRKLNVWQRAHALALAAHRVLPASPVRGSGASRNQLLRAISSVPANIAEGCGKRTDAEFSRYLDIALGSAKESENHLLFARDMGWIGAMAFADLDERLTEVRRMLYSLAKVMRSRVEAAPGSVGESGKNEAEPEAKAEQ